LASGLGVAPGLGLVSVEAEAARGAWCRETSWAPAPALARTIAAAPTAAAARYLTLSLNMLSRVPPVQVGSFAGGSTVRHGKDNAHRWRSRKSAPGPQCPSALA